MKSLIFVAILFLSVFDSSIAHRRRFYKSVIINSDVGQGVPQALPQVSQNVESGDINQQQQQIHKEYVFGPTAEIRKDFGFGFYPQIRKEYVLNARSNVASAADSIPKQSDNTVAKEIDNTVIKETVVSQVSPTVSAPVPATVPINNNINVGGPGYTSTNTLTKTYSIPNPAPIFGSIFDTVRDVTLRIVNNVVGVKSYVAGGGGISKTVTLQQN